MDLDPDFAFKPLRDITRALRFPAPPLDSPQPAPQAPASSTPVSSTPVSSTLGPLQDLPGKWKGTGFNVIWRPNNTPGQDRFLELNLTDETLEFEEIPGNIPNRGLLQADIDMFGVRYLQQIKDLNNGAGLHIEPGIWAIVPQTDNPAVVPTVLRMGSIPHGTTILAQGVSTLIAGPPTIPPVSIVPFVIGNPNQTIDFPESDLSTPTRFRSPPADIANISQEMVKNPNAVLLGAVGSQQVANTVQLTVSTDPTFPVLGGGVANTAFLQGNPVAGPNAQAALVTSTFWIQTIPSTSGGPDIHLLQYTQTVLLNFNGLSWPHVTVGTLQKVDDNLVAMDDQRAGQAG